MAEIKNWAGYLTEMRKPMLDKIFFMDKIFEPFSTVVDYGCADGSLIRICKELFPQYNYIGYDNCGDMVTLAKQSDNLGVYTTDWSDIHINPDESLLNLSSVIHEVYSYCNKQEIDEFWDRVLGSGFKYVTIRDMCPTRELVKGYSMPVMFGSTLETMPNKYYEKYRELNGDRKCHISDKETIHSLLKLQYAFGGNWEREKKENYLPLDDEDFALIAKEYRYEVVYKNHEILPYFKWWAKHNLGVTIATPTHIKLILRKG